MPELLKGKALEDAIRYTQIAVCEAANAACAKDTRGVIIVKDDLVIGRGANHPPKPFVCSPDYCKDICRTYAVHAELNAILDAYKNGHDLRGAQMYHANVKDGVLVDSRKPRCADCSKHVLTVGIERFILKHAEGYTSYGAEEFHRLSLDAVKPL